jgi:hypothetical protein
MEAIARSSPSLLGDNRAPRRGQLCSGCQIEEVVDELNLPKEEAV